MESEQQPCTICGDLEPTHVHNTDGSRIEAFFTVGRGENEMSAAIRWQGRARRAERLVRKFGNHKTGCYCFICRNLSDAEKVQLGQILGR